MDYEFWRGLENKESKTEEEKLLLKLYYTIAIISETLVDNSKCHYTDERALEYIKKSVDEVINEL